MGGEGGTWCFFLFPFSHFFMPFSNSLPLPPENSAPLSVSPIYFSLFLSFTPFLCNLSFPTSQKNRLLLLSPPSSSLFLSLIDTILSSSVRPKSLVHPGLSSLALLLLSQDGPVCFHGIFKGTHSTKKPLSWEYRAYWFAWNWVPKKEPTLPLILILENTMGQFCLHWVEFLGIQRNPLNHEFLILKI